MTKHENKQATHAPGHFGNKGLEPNAGVSKVSDREEQYQRNRDQAPTDQGGRMDDKAPPDQDNNLGRGAPSDRDERIKKLAQEKASRSK